MSEDIFYADAATLARRIRDRSLSPVEVAQAHLDRIEAVNPKLNALIAFPDGVMERAREAEAAAMRGEFWGPLHGVPFTVKDCVDTAGVVTTRGSKPVRRSCPRRRRDGGDPAEGTPAASSSPSRTCPSSPCGGRPTTSSTDAPRTPG